MNQRRFLLGLAAVLFAFAVFAWLQFSPAMFGWMHDDSYYLASAKALAEGRGFIMPSVPGEPPQTKYPPLYPLVLALVWKIFPEFPANLTPGLILNLLFACGFLGASAALLRQLGASRAETLVLTGVAAFHPMTVQWTGMLMSDMLFSALGVAGLAVGGWALGQDDGRRSRTIFGVAVLLLTLATLTRTLGVALALGLAAAAWLKGRRLAGVSALIACLPALLGVARALTGGGPEPLPGTEQLAGYQRSWFYYTSYLGYWRASVPDLETLRLQVIEIFGEALRYPAQLCFMIPTEVSPLRELAAAVSIGVVWGIFGRMRAGGVHPIHLAALFNLPIVLLWNFALMSRFWMPFTALILAGAAFELRRLGTAILGTLRGDAPRADKVISGAIGVLGASLVVYAGVRILWLDPQRSAEYWQERWAAFSERREAYDWIRANTAPEDRIISVEDAVLYLHTGRQGMAPATGTTAPYFHRSEDMFRAELAGIADTAAAVGAKYWLRTPEDFALESAEDTMAEAVDEVLEEAEAVFESSGGTVRLYRIRDLAEGTKGFDGGA